MRAPRLLVGLLSLTLLPALVAAPAWRARAAEAATDVAARAAALKKKGDAAMDALNYADAVAAYTEAYEVGKDPAVLYNKGRALQALGRYPEAVAELERFRAEAPPELRAKVPKLDALIDEVRAHVSTLTVTCGVAGAHVRVGGREIGVTPLAKPVALVAGKARLEISADGYLPYAKELELPGGGALTIDAALVKQVGNGFLVVQSPIAGASVFVDGKVQGTAPIEVSLPEGAHVVVLRREGYDEGESKASVVAGERRTLTIDLAKRAGITSKWWFWTGVGVVVVGGVVVTAALLTERSPSSGDSFSPSRVSGPLLTF